MDIVDPEKLQHQVPSQHLRPSHHIIRENARIFSPPGGGLPRTRSVQHTIKLTTDQPFRLRPYQYSEVKRREIEKQVQEMLSAGIIEQCTWNFPTSDVPGSARWTTAHMSCLPRRRNHLLKVLGGTSPAPGQSLGALAPVRANSSHRQMSIRYDAAGVSRLQHHTFWK